MEINVRKEKKIVEVWLTNAEQENPATQERLRPLYAHYKPLKYMVVVFQSGKRDLYRSTLDLLSYNKKRIEELAVLREKQLENAAG